MIPGANRAVAAGSIRAPAAANGLYGLRPSLGVAPMGGIYPLSRLVINASRPIRLNSLHIPVQYQ